MRIELAVKSPPQLLADFMEAKKKAAPPKGEQGKDDAGYSPWPRSVTDYLIKRFDQEFEFRYFVLDRSQFDEKFNSKPDYVPQPLGDDRRSGAKILQSLIRVNFMKAQRDMAGEGTSDRAEIYHGDSVDSTKATSSSMRRTLTRCVRWPIRNLS